MKEWSKIKLFFRYSGMLVYWFVLRPVYEGAKVVVICRGEVLLIRHTFAPGYFSFPGGTVEKGESPQETAVRELKEEVGLNINQADLVTLGSFSSRQFWKHDTCHCFTVQVTDKNFKIDEVEITEAKWFPVDNLPSNLGQKNAKRIWEFYCQHKNMITSGND